MKNGEIEALMALKDIAHQLRIANKLKAWELKVNYREEDADLDITSEIDEIMKS